MNNAALSLPSRADLWHAPLDDMWHALPLMTRGMPCP